MAPNRIMVIGTINKDSIKPPRGKKYQSYGGLLYSLITLARLLRKEDEIYPVVNLGSDSRKPVFEILKKYPMIKTDFIKTVRQKNNHAKIEYLDDDFKSEVLKGGVPPIRFRDLKALLKKCNFALVNFVSGVDLSLKTLEKLRAEFNGDIYIDIHSLTLGIRKDGTRYLRRPRNWRRYCACADYLQMNVEEYKLLSVFDPSNQELIAFLNSFSGIGPRAVIITAGRDGALLAYKTGSGETARLIKPIKISKVKDTTGSGDIFGGAFCAAVLRGSSMIKAAGQANDIAARSVRVQGVENLNFRKFKK